MVLDHQRHGQGRDDGSKGGVVAYVELRSGGGAPVHGVGIDPEADAASIKAMLSATNRLATSLAAHPRAQAAR